MYVYSVASISLGIFVVEIVNIVSASLLGNWCACWANTASNCHCALRWADNDEDDDALMTMMPPEMGWAESWGTERESERYRQSVSQAEPGTVQPISHQIRLTSCSRTLLPPPGSERRAGLGTGLHLKAAIHRGRSGGGEHFPYFVFLLPTDFVYTNRKEASIHPSIYPSCHHISGPSFYTSSQIEVGMAARSSSNPVAKLQQKPNDLTMNAASRPPPPPLPPSPYANIVDAKKEEKKKKKKKQKEKQNIDWQRTGHCRRTLWTDPVLRRNMNASPVQNELIISNS